MEDQRAARRRTATARSESEDTRPRSGNSTPRGAQEAAERACRDLAELISHRPEGVSAVCRGEGGWVVSVDVLEVPRIPDTTSLLATYEVELDGDGTLRQYRRVRRYRRGSADN